MPSKKSKQKLDLSAEIRIKNAARRVFHAKGFYATRTRDIAKEAGINLALLNYYFRSKENLFNLIMLETLKEFMSSLSQIFNNENTNLEEKIEAIVSAYIDLLVLEPHIPIFILSELRNNPQELLKHLKARELIMDSVFIRQFIKKTNRKQGNRTGSPLHFIMNLMSLTVFPFIASPILMNIGELSDQQFKTLMIERKRNIPDWIVSMWDLN